MDAKICDHIINIAILFMEKEILFFLILNRQKFRRIYLIKKASIILLIDKARKLKAKLFFKNL